MHRNYINGKKMFELGNIKEAYDLYSLDYENDCLSLYGLFVLTQIGFISNINDIRRIQDLFSKRFCEIVDLSSQKDELAMYVLGVCYERGIVVDKNLQLAIDNYSYCYDKGNLDAGFNLALIYQESKDYKNIDRAIEIYEDLCKREYFEAFVNLGYIYFYDKEHKDLSRAQKYFEQSANNNDPLAQYYLGVLLNENGQQEMSEVWLRESVNNGNILAMVYYSDYLFSTNNEDVFEQAFQLIDSAARQGFPSAIYKVGLCYEFGKGIEKNVAIAKVLYMKASELGVQEAKIRLEKLKKEKV